MYIPVCLINNHLASIYNVLADGEGRAKFLTSDDLQYLAALISKHYGEDEEAYLTNFTLRRGRSVPSTPRFCALPYRIEKEKFGEEFVYSQEYLAKYRRLYDTCIERFGRKSDRDTDEERIQLAQDLAFLKSQEEGFVDPTVSSLYDASCSQILEDIRYRDFLASSPSSSRLSVAIQNRKMSDGEKAQWINSQFYIMKNIPEENKDVILDGLLNLYEEYFNSGLPYIFYYQQTRLNPNIGVKLRFGEKEKQRFKKAIQFAIEDFAKSSRPRINNASYDYLQEMVNQSSSNLT